MTKMDDVLACLNAHGAMSATELAQRMGVTVRSLRSTLENLAQKDAVERHRRVGGRVCWAPLTDKVGQRPPYFADRAKLPAWLAGVGA